MRLGSIKSMSNVKYMRRIGAGIKTSALSFELHPLHSLFQNSGENTGSYHTVLIRN